ncbi:hypothetical protein [Amphritea opalescens]|nr:hypothetical protein [Amphritea opalescens]
MKKAVGQAFCATHNENILRGSIALLDGDSVAENQSSRAGKIGLILD